MSPTLRFALPSTTPEHPIDSPLHTRPPTPFPSPVFTPPATPLNISPNSSTTSLLFFHPISGYDHNYYHPNHYHSDRSHSNPTNPHHHSTNATTTTHHPTSHPPMSQTEKRHSLSAPAPAHSLDRKSPSPLREALDTQHTHQARARQEWARQCWVVRAWKTARGRRPEILSRKIVMRVEEGKRFCLDQ